MCEEVQEIRLHQIDRQIEFDEENHLYRVSGEIKPSVSEIMKPMSSAYYAGINAQTLGNAADRGTRVHEAVELYEKLGLITEDEEVRPFLTHYRVIKKLEGFECLENEARFTDGDYCGTVDMIAKKDGDVVLIDLKATAKINTELLEVQLAAYSNLLRANGIDPKRCYVLHLKPTGAKLKEIRPNYPMWEELKNSYKLQ